MTAKTLVLGASGFLGSHFTQKPSQETLQFRAKPEESIKNSLILDPWNFDELERILKVNKFNSIINCIALANIERCERDESEAFEINSELPRKLAELCRKCSVHFIHVSTDAVLADGSGLLDEESPTIPQSIYGKSKLLGEKLVLDALPIATIARVNFFGVSPRKNSIFDFFYDSLKREQPTMGFTDVYFSPLYVEDTVSALRRLVADRYTGIVNLASSIPISKYEFGKKIAVHLGISPELIIETRAKDLPLGQIRSLGLSINNQKMLHFYQPRFSIDEGILLSIKQREREVLD